MFSIIKNFFNPFRYQVLVDDKKSEPLVKNIEVKNATDWINDADDWGDDDETETGDLGSFNFSNHSNSNIMLTQQPKTSSLNVQLK